MFKYQKDNTYFAQIGTGFEAVAINELIDLGAGRIEPGFRGIHFAADPAVLYRINYCARLLTRVLAPLVSFKCRDRDDLYRAGRAIDWDRFFSLNDTFAVFANVSNSEKIRHSKFAALCLKDAVADSFRGKFGKRPNVDALDPDVSINLHIRELGATVSLDVSGGSMHRRGYRVETVQAPMAETLAAAIVELSGWKGEGPLYDPMCGSGTLLIEAAMKAGNIPSGFLRKNHGLRFLPDFDQKLWDKVRMEENGKMRRLAAGLVAGSDLDGSAVKAARANARTVPGGEAIRLSRMDFREIPGLENMTILCNPPYGVRMREEKDLDLLYREFGDFLKRRCKGSRAFVYFGKREMIKKIGLRPTWKKALRNANLDGRLAMYELF